MKVFDMLLAVAAVIEGMVLLLRDFYSREAFVGGLFVAGGVSYLLSLLRRRRRVPQQTHDHDE